MVVPGTHSNIAAMPLKGKFGVSNLPSLTQVLVPKEIAIIVALLQHLHEVL